MWYCSKCQLEVRCRRLRRQQVVKWYHVHDHTLICVGAVAVTFSDEVITREWATHEEDRAWVNL